MLGEVSPVQVRDSFCSYMATGGSASKTGVFIVHLP